MLSRLIRFFLEQRLVVVLLLVFVVGWGLMTAPFDWDLGSFPRNPVAVDAIPDIGENQQIVFTEWMGRSPQDVEDQVTYPLTVSLLGVPGVKTVRSYSYFGFSSIYVLFDEDVEFYWSRSRLLEKLNSLPAGTLPGGVAPALGPDATPLGQVFWYTLEGRDEHGNPAGGWDLDELRSVQDWHVRYALLAAEGVAEVASVGGYVREYQVDVDPDAMRAHRVTLDQVVRAVRDSNLEVGARVIEINRVEYFVRGRGWIEELADIEESVIASTGGVPIRVKDVGSVSMGPALRRGALDKGGSEAVGGVVVVRYGSNTLATLDNVKAKIEEIAPGLPRKTLADGRVSQLTIVPFYDRTGLIEETLGTLDTAIFDEILITIMVVVFMVMHLASSLLISALLPVAVLFTFIAMKLFGVDANIVALSGIAIAIGTMVDMGIVLCENILRRLDEAAPDERHLEVVHKASVEVASAVVTAVATTIVGFLPVFTMTGAEGKLFRPLAFTKTFALGGSVIVALLLIPSFALLLFPLRGGRLGEWWRARAARRPRLGRAGPWLLNALVFLVVAIVLARHWQPLGVGRSELLQLLFVLLPLLTVLVGFWFLRRSYEPVLRWCLSHKSLFLGAAGGIVLLGALAWLGVDKLFGFVPGAVQRSAPWHDARDVFPGLGKEFMPPLDEGSFLFMPTTMPHASMGEALDVLAKLDRALEAIPEVAQAVGKLGRVDSPLDPAPISMFETIIHYKPEWGVDAEGEPVRQWRDHIRGPDDIWDEIVAATRLPGTVTAPKLQPIETRLVMLQTGMRAPMGVKVKGPDLETLERVALEIEHLLKQVPAVRPETVLADRVVGKPYLEIDVDRRAAARHGVSIRQVQEVIEVALGGRQLTTTVEGRERYPVRVRYKRELRDSLEGMLDVLVPTPSGAQVPFAELARIDFVRGPQVIKTEDTFLTAYVVFDKTAGMAEVDTVEQAKRFLDAQLESGAWQLPAGVSFSFSGSYENQLRAEATLQVVLPVTLLIIFLILYFQFRKVSTTSMVFAGVFVAWSGGFLLVWLYGKPWFLDFEVFGASMRQVFQVGPVNMSVAVWVGFLALFGIATDDGVVMGTYLDQSFAKRQPDTVAEVRAAVLAAGSRRVRPCLMTTATTLLALLPVLSSSGRGSDVMLHMAIPSVGGMIVAVLTMFMVPVLYSWVHERRCRTDASVIQPHASDPVS